MADAMEQGHKKTSIWVKAALPMVFALNTANADDLAEGPSASFDLSSHHINLTESFRQPLEETINLAPEEILDRPIAKDLEIPEIDDKARFIESIKETIGLGSWQYNEQYEGLTRDLFTLPVNLFRTQLDVKIQFMVARDGNGDPPAPHGMERLYRNDRPTTVGLQFQIPLELKKNP